MDRILHYSGAGGDRHTCAPSERRFLLLFSTASKKAETFGKHPAVFQNGPKKISANFLLLLLQKPPQNPLSALGSCTTPASLMFFVLGVFGTSYLPLFPFSFLEYSSPALAHAGTAGLFRSQSSIWCRLRLVAFQGLWFGASTHTSLRDFSRCCIRLAETLSPHDHTHRATKFLLRFWNENEFCGRTSSREHAVLRSLAPLVFIYFFILNPRVYPRRMSVG